jgi:uncharacterized protein YdaU (DUF1376 family)
MHYYQFNIGDYVSHTRHLSPIEDIAYRRLLDAYYLSERPLNIGVTAVARQIGMREYEAEVKLVLEEFFELGEDGWINTRADKEINHFHSKIQQASRAGKASAERRSNARSADVQPTNNQEPITNNHKPKKEKATVVATPVGVSESVWLDFVALRKSKKAPLTNTALQGLMREAAKAKMTLEQVMSTCCERGWVGFKADWMVGQAIRVNPADIARVTVPSSNQPDPALMKIAEDRKRATPIPDSVKEQMARILNKKVL